MVTTSMTNRLADSRWLPVAAVVVALVCAAAYLSRLDHAHIDLEVYRFAVWEWWSGGDVYGELPATAVGLSLPFIYPPFAVVPAIPFAVLPWWLSYAFLFALSIACVFGTIFLIGRRLWPSSGRHGAVVLASASVPLSLTLEPIRDTFSFGQINLLLMGLVAVDCLARRPWWPRGIGVGLAAAVKLTPAAFVLYFLIRKDYRAAAVAAITGVAATAIGFLIDTPGSIKYWFGGFAGAASISGSTYRTNQTIQAVMARFGLEKPLLTIVVALLVLALLAVTVVAMRRHEPVVALMVCAAFSLLASPTSWSHHWVWIAPALIVMSAYTARAWQERTPARFGLLAGFAVTWAFFIVAPFHRLPGNDDWIPAPVDLEQTWSPVQHLFGNSYVIIGLAWVIGCALFGVRARKRDAVVQDTVSQPG